MKLAVGYSDVARDQLGKLKAEREGTPKHQTYEGFRHFIEAVVSESELAFLPQHWLHDDLKGVLRVKKGRMRLFFIASKEHAAAKVLMIGYRKKGDKRDAYEEFRRALRSGQFDPLFQELGQKPVRP